MLLTLLSIFLILTSIFIWCVPVFNYRGINLTLGEKYDGLNVLAGLSLAFGIVGIIFCIPIISVVQINRQIDYEECLYEKEVLEYRLEYKDEIVVGNELLYQEITDFNNKLRVTKRYANNLWVNWFFNQLIADIDYIDIGGQND